MIKELKNDIEFEEKMLDAFRKIYKKTSSEESKALLIEIGESAKKRIMNLKSKIRQTVLATDQRELLTIYFE